MNNKSIALNVLKIRNIMLQKISHLYKSEFNKTRKTEAVLLIITNGKKEHNLFVKNLNFLLKPLNHCSEHYCLNCLKPFRTKPKLEKHQIVNHFHNQSPILSQSHQ